MSPPAHVGGGAIQLVVNDSLTLNGTISANGAAGAAGQFEAGAGGSGGSVWIDTRTLSGEGTVRANGGAGGVSSFGTAGGGGGGRVVVYSNNADPEITVSASGGSGHQSGASGSTYLEGDNDTPEPTATPSPTPAITATRTLTPTPGASLTGTVAIFTYDGDGKMVKSEIDGVITVFVSAAYQVKDPAGQAVVTKYYEGGAFRVDGTLYYSLTDHLGSTGVTAGEDGAQVSEMRYKAWGEVRYSNGTIPTDRTYTGQRSYTNDFGLMFYNARWYDSVLGRFAQADTIIPPGPQGYDHYAYTNNNPINHIDPSGHCALSGHWMPDDSSACTSTTGTNARVTGSANGSVNGAVSSTIGSRVSTRPDIDGNLVFTTDDWRPTLAQIPPQFYDDASFALDGAALEADIGGVVNSLSSTIKFSQYGPVGTAFGYLTGEKLAARYVTTGNILATLSTASTTASEIVTNETYLELYDVSETPSNFSFSHFPRYQLSGVVGTDTLFSAVPTLIGWIPMPSYGSTFIQGGVVVNNFIGRFGGCNAQCIFDYPILDLR